MCSQRSRGGNPFVSIFFNIASLELLLKEKITKTSLERGANEKLLFCLVYYLLFYRNNNNNNN